MGERYIIVEVGTFADGEVSKAFQVFERERDFNHEWYSLWCGGDNDPVSLNKARERVESLNLLHPGGG